MKHILVLPAKSYPSRKYGTIQVTLQRLAIGAVKRFLSIPSSLWARRFSVSDHS